MPTPTMNEEFVLIFDAMLQARLRLHAGRRETGGTRDQTTTQEIVDLLGIAHRLTNAQSQELLAHTDRSLISQIEDLTH